MAEVKPEHLITPPVVVKQLDMATMVPEDQDFSSEFSLVLGEAAAAAAGGRQQCCALVVWFDTDFTARFCAGGAAQPWLLVQLLLLLL